MMGCVMPGRCDGRVQLHHLIPQQRIRSEYKTMAWKGVDPPFTLTAALTDRRNLVGLCHLHHGRVEGRRVYVTRDQLPAGFEEFAGELGLGWFVEVHWGRAAA